MTLRLVCLLCLLGGYCFGMFESGVVIGKIIGKDPRKGGSGNIGATNMVRVAGLGPGLLTLILDLVKVFLAVILANVIVRGVLDLSIDYRALCLYTGLGAVLGHDFPVYLKFKGGKGVAGTVALIICLGDWKLIVIGALAFFIPFLITKYVSLGSLCLVSACFIGFIIFMFTGLTYVAAGWEADCIIIFAVLVFLVFIQHRENIARLAKGEEKKLSLKK